MINYLNDVNTINEFKYKNLLNTEVKFIYDNFKDLKLRTLDVKLIFNNYSKGNDEPKLIYNLPPSSSTNLISKVLTSFLEVLQGTEKEPKSQLSHYYLGIIESSVVKVDKLDGDSRHSAIQWYVNQLKDFYYSDKNKCSHDDKLKILSLIKQYEFTLKIASGIQIIINAKSKFVDGLKASPKEVQKYLFDLILTKLDDLPIGDRIVLPGGHQGSEGNYGHAVLYSIKKTSQNVFSFKVINTGEGSQKILGEGSRRHTKDVSYDNIPLSSLVTALSDCFIDDLESDQMSGIYKLLDELFRSYSSISLGRTHTVQTKGSCTHKCLAADAHEFLGDKLYRHFKRWMTEKGINQLADIKPFEDIDDRTIQLLIMEGQKFLKKRELKLGALSAILDKS